jgi:hypothetical protein
MEKHPIHNPRVISRRNLLGGIGSAATLGYMVHSGLKHNEEETRIIETKDEELAEDEEAFEAYNELSDSGYFNYDVERFAEEFALEVGEVLENREVYAAIQENFLLPNIDHSFLRQQLEALAPAIGFAESRYKDALSEVGAFGVMQLMPGTWEELSTNML